MSTTPIKGIEKPKCMKRQLHKLARTVIEMGNIILDIRRETEVNVVNTKEKTSVPKSPADEVLRYSDESDSDEINEDDVEEDGSEEGEPFDKSVHATDPNVLSTPQPSPAFWVPDVQQIPQEEKKPLEKQIIIQVFDMGDANDRQKANDVCVTLGKEGFQHTKVMDVGKGRWGTLLKYIFEK